MPKKLAQKVDACTHVSNDKNNEIWAIQEVGELTTDEKLKEYSATVAELSQKVSYLMEQVEKRNVDDEKIARFLAEKKRQRDEEKKKKREAKKRKG